MNKLSALRYIIYIAEIFFSFVFQGTPYLIPEVFGGKAVLLAALAVSFAFFEGDIVSIVLASVCGLLTDCSYSRTVGYYAIALVISCYFVSNIFESCIIRNLLTVMMVSTVLIPIIIIMQFVIYYAAAGYRGIWYFFFRHYVSRIIYTLAFVPVFYKINGFVYYRAFRKRGGEKTFWKKYP